MATSMNTTAAAEQPPAVAALVQIQSISSKRVNLFAVAECARLARKEKAATLFIPECFEVSGKVRRKHSTMPNRPSKWDKAGAPNN